MSLKEPKHDTPRWLAAVYAVLFYIGVIAFIYTVDRLVGVN